MCVSPKATTTQQQQHDPPFAAEAVLRDQPSSTPHDEPTDTTQIIRNFAFGSNMSHAKLCKRLGTLNETLPTRGKKAVLKDYRLTMDLAFAPPTEPAFASLLPSEGNCLYGVVYDLTLKQYEVLYRSEGGPEGGYSEQVVYPEIMEESGERVCAIAFKTKSYWALKIPHAMKPSLRYKNMLVNGAKEAKLPDHYVEKLGEIEAARPVGYIMRVLVQLQYVSIFAIAKTRIRPLVAAIGWTRPIAGFIYGVGEYLRDVTPVSAASRVVESIALLALVLSVLPFSIIGAMVAASQGRLKTVVKSVELTRLIDDHASQTKRQ